MNDWTEVEEVLLRHAGIREAAVIVVPDDVGGKMIKAIVVPAPGARLGAAEVLAFAASQLADHQRPRAVDFVPELPGDLNPTGETAPPADGST